MSITSRLRAVILAGALLVSVQAQMMDSGREASLIDDMVCRGDYLDALKLTKRTFLYGNVDRVKLAPYVGALLIETGQLQAADRVLNPKSVNSDTPPITRAALTRERAVLLLAKGEYKLSAVQAAEAYNFSLRDDIYKARRAYAGSIVAESLLRSEDLNGAREYADQSLKAVQKQKKAADFFIPRVFYAACLVASYGSSPETAEPICLSGLALTKRSQKPRRDLSLGYLVLAEARLRAGKVEASRAAANQSLTLTKTLFGPVHQDAVKAVELISLADFKDGKRTEARTEAKSALAVAKKLFGPGSKRVAELTETLQEAIH